MEIVEAEVDCASAIVPRTLGGVGHEDFPLGWRGVPENLGDIPRAVGVMNQEPVAELLDLAMRADERLCGGALHERSRLSVDRRAEKIVAGGVANVEMN